MFGLKTYLIGGLVTVCLGVGWYALKQHDRAVAAAAVIEIYQERVDSLTSRADSTYAEWVASDSSRDARIAELEKEVAEHAAVTDSLTQIELPAARENVDTLLAVLRENADTSLLPVVDALSEAIEGERRTSAQRFQSQVRAIGTLMSEVQTLRADRALADEVISNERAARVELEAQLQRVQLALNRGDFLKDKVLPFAVGVGATLLLDKAIN